MWTIPQKRGIFEETVRLNFRPAKPADFPACCGVLAEFERSYYDGEVLRALPEVWAELAAREALSISVFEDEDLPPKRRLLGLGTGIFVDDAFCAQVLADPKPYLANRVYRSCLDGRSPVLGYKAIRQANSIGGVNLLPLDFALAACDLFGLETFPLLAVVWEAFQFNFYGYRLNWIVQEVFGEDWRDFLLAAGLKVYSDYGDAQPKPRPFLMGTSREDFRKRAGSRYTFFFTAPAPRFYFSHAQQKLLLLALRDIGDQEAARELGVSAHTVKELWKSILLRVEDVSPDLFCCDAIYLGRRGPEKRRHLLDYLAHHLEELRPWRKPRGFIPSLR